MSFVGLLDNARGDSYSYAEFAFDGDSYSYAEFAFDGYCVLLAVPRAVVVGDCGSDARFVVWVLQWSDDDPFFEFAAKPPQNPKTPGLTRRSCIFGR